MIGRELGVAYVVLSMVSSTEELVRARDRTAVWAEMHERSREDVL